MRMSQPRSGLPSTSISSVTAVFGAPVVIGLLVRRQTQEGNG